jgi:CrcB protein
VTATVAAWVALGAALGAPMRFVVERRLSASWPWGTWLVNVVGSAVLGVLLGVIAGRGSQGSTTAVVALVGTGFCGSLTTFGGFAAQVLDLALAPLDQAGRVRAVRALGYAALSVLTCVAVAAAAYVTARAFTGG